MTETMTPGASYILQGAMYFYRDKNIYCRYQYTLRDPVDPALLQGGRRPGRSGLL